MKVYYCSLAATLSCFLVAQSALGQSLKHPVSVRPASLASDGYYGYYYGDEEEEASPSDAVAKSIADDPAPMSHGSSCCDPCCDIVCCDGCDGCGGGGCLGGLFGGSGCYLFGPEEPITVWPADAAIQVGGWTSIGYHSKAVPLSRNYGDLLSFNDVPNQVNLHQQWVYMEKALDTEDGLDWGGRVDFMYGTDAQKTQAFGTTGGWDNDWDHGVYGFALPQAYLEVGCGSLSIKGGHFFTLVGYEVVTAPDNFFYSHALTMFNSEPFTHTGFIATYEWGDRLTSYAGWTLGWDTGFRQFNNGSNYLGGFSYSLGDDITLTYISTAGDFGFRGKDAYGHSIVLDVNVTENLNYVFQSDLLDINDLTSAGNQGAPENREENFGINQYLFYNWNDCLSFGGRMEWWKAEGNSYYALTGGINYRAAANLIVRPEVRHDWQPFDSFERTTFGMDAILTY
jgi:hypothetical protein